MSTAAVPVTGHAADRVAPILRVRDLRIRFRAPGRSTTALAGVDLDIRAGEVLGVVGETGCGKTVTGLAVLGLLPASASVEADELSLDGRDLLSLDDGARRSMRGSDVAMVFQNPAGSFNPVFTIGSQMRSVVAAHTDLRGRAADERVAETLADCALPDVERVARAYPHQLSGGMLQRAMIAMALLASPRLLIADEPTTALDVTIAAQVLDLIARLQRERGFSVLFITHDLGVVRRIADRVAVLYAGRVVETAATADLFDDPRHPYTRGLMAAIPRTARAGGRLETMPGAVPEDPGAVLGCAFRDRCPIAVERCVVDRPGLRELGTDHGAACHLADIAAASGEGRR